MVKDVLGMLVFFVAFIAFWFWLVYRFIMPKITKEKYRIWIEGALIIAIIISASFVLYFFDNMISVLLKNILNF